MYNKLFTGPMFSGKTRRLVIELERYVLAKRHVAWFEPKKDTRGGSHGDFISHRMQELKNIEYVHRFDLSKPEDVISITTELCKDYKIECIFIDEFFMIEFTRQFFYDYQFSTLKDIPMIFAGLITGADSNIMKTAIPVIPYMDEIKKFTAICMNCGKTANYTCFLGDWDKSDPIDNGKNYKVFCADCYMKYTKKPLTHTWKG